jgi:hypothetical protein
MKYKLHIPFGSRVDLLHEAVESVRDIGNIHLWADGIPCPDIPDVTKHEMGLVSVVSLINICIKESWDDDVMFLCHNDAYAKPGIAKQFLEFTRNAFETDKKWGLILSHYDVLAAFNMAAVHDVGYWDPMYFQYRADVDYYHTLKKAGWHELDSKLSEGIVHHGSQTVKSDPLFNYRTRFRNSLDFDGRYYLLKWGGHPGQERFSRPFEDFRPDQPHFRYMPVRPSPMTIPRPNQLQRIRRTPGGVKA